MLSRIYAREVEEEEEVVEKERKAYHSFHLHLFDIQHKMCAKLPSRLPGQDLK